MILAITAYLGNAIQQERTYTIYIHTVYLFISGVEVIKQLSGDGYVVFSPQIEAISFPWYNSMSFRTREKFGLLMSISIGSSASILEVRQFHQLFHARAKEVESTLTPCPFVCCSVSFGDE